MCPGSLVLFLHHCPSCPHCLPFTHFPQLNSKTPHFPPIRTRLLSPTHSPGPSVVGAGCLCGHPSWTHLDPVSHKHCRLHWSCPACLCPGSLLSHQNCKCLAVTFYLSIAPLALAHKRRLHKQILSDIHPPTHLPRRRLGAGGSVGAPPAPRGSRGRSIDGQAGLLRSRHRPHLAR